MSNRPIIFSAPMVRALLDGRKTQHRLPIKLPTRGGREYVNPRLGGWEATTFGGGGCFSIARDGSRAPTPEMAAIWNRTTGTCVVAPAQVGDRLWIGEDYQPAKTGQDDDVVRFRVDGAIYSISPQGAVDRALAGDRPALKVGRWRQTPRWASRLTLLVTDIRVERLAEISEDDAIAEGVVAFAESRDRPGSWEGLSEADRLGMTRVTYGSAKRAFQHLWEHLHGPDAWKANPWICAISFEVRAGNIDRLQAAEERAAA